MALRTPLTVSPHMYIGDSTGRPLDYGMVYFGEPDKDPEFYPIDIFSDDSLTVPVSQPVRTKGGYLNDNKGDMAEIHAKELIYSVKVLDQYGRKIFYKGQSMRSTWNDDVIIRINEAIIDSSTKAEKVARDITNEAINNTAVEGGVLADTFVIATPKDDDAIPRSLRDVSSAKVSLKDYKSESRTWEQALALAFKRGEREIDGDFETISLTSAVIANADNVTLKNMTLDITNITPQTGVAGDFLTFTGTQSDPLSFISDTLEGYSAVELSNASEFTAGDYVWIESDKWFIDPADFPNPQSEVASAIGQIGRIKRIESNVIYLYEGVLYDFNVSDNARISKINPKSRIKLDNVTIVGRNNGNQLGIVFDRCVDVELNNIETQGIAYAGVMLRRCLNVVINTPRFYDAQKAGLSYGIAIADGCHNIVVNQPYGQDLRHIVTAGGRKGANHYITVNDVQGKGMRDSALDCHPSTRFVKFKGGHIECAPEIEGGREGITFQGRDIEVDNITVVGAVTKAVNIEGYSAEGSKNSIKVSNITLKTASPTATAVNIETKSKGTISLLEISRVTTSENEFGAGVVIDAAVGDVNNVVVANNPRLSSSGSTVLLKAQGVGSIDGVRIYANNIDGAQQPVYLRGLAGNIKDVSVHSNHIDTPGAYAIRLSGVDGFRERNNICGGNTNDRVFVEPSCSNLVIDSAASSVKTSTSSASIVKNDDYYLVINRPQSTHTTTLPDAAVYPNKELSIKNQAAQLVISASNNVVGLAGGAASNAILPAVTGAWAILRSNGTNWEIMQSGQPVATTP